jgi:hypothetical protein
LSDEAVDKLARAMIDYSSSGERDSLALIERGMALFDGTRNELE